MEPLAENTIRASFANCSKGEAKRLALPGKLTEIDWTELDFLGWRDPKATGNGYVVFPRGSEVVGLALAATPGRIKQSMCAFCLTTHGTGDVALFAARRAGAAGKLGNTVGTYLCADLACSLYVRGRRKPAVPNPKESLSTEERAERMLANLNRFADEVLAE
ncbi:FBP domain-containing protein [Crossiella sp. SN42]|uniref:FBP domain-containing protein n=1 Tax=Crossiella sp. SN42 TaxID=2944808 RepID=UPI00207D535B|nr:FBP domain-containing protein [Crossiella sp. SN42]MCO1574482.1 FBP domain-containing protein [Crossiella sp. SN42]